jgi:succinate dehydrogenase/fumarate reductase cytochrome b subunit
MLADKVVDWDKIFEVVYSSLGVALAVSIAFSFAVAGSTRFAEERRDGNAARATVWAVLAAFGVAVCIAGIVLAIVVMTTKD